MRRSRRGQRTATKPLGDTSDPQGFPALAHEYLEWLRARNYADTTVQARTKLLRMLIEWLEQRGVSRPAQVTKPILERYQLFLFHYRKANGKPLSFACQHQRLIPIRMLFRWLAKYNHILSNPAADLELPRREHRLPKAVLSAVEAERVMQAAMAMKSPLSLRNRAMFETFYSTGMRRRELIELHVHDLDFDRRTVCIRQGKGKKDRMVPIGERALEWVERYLNEQRPLLVVAPDEGYVFLTESGEKIDPDQLSDLVRRHIDRANLGKTGSCHLFRHTMATLMLENGADIRYVQEMLGHTNLSTTAIYTHVSIRRLQEVHSATHPAAKSDVPSADEG